MTDRQRLYLIDGSSYIFRAYYAIRHLTNSSGMSTNAIFGFTNMLLKIIRDEQPDLLAVIFDRRADLREPAGGQQSAVEGPQPADALWFVKSGGGRSSR